MTGAAPRDKPRASRQRWWVVAAVALLVSVGLWAARDDARAAITALLHADPVWVLLSIPVLFGWYIAWSAVHLSSRRVVEVTPAGDRLLALLPVTASAIALNLVAKSGGLAGLAGFLSRARQRSEPRGRTIAAYLLATVATELGFVVVLLIALASVVEDGQLTGSEAVTLAVFLFYTTVRLSLLAVAARSRTALRRLWTLPARTVDRVLRRPPRPVNTETADELYDAVAVARRRPLRALLPLLAAVAADVLAAVMLWVAILAVTGDSLPETALITYGVSSLFGIVGFLPGGLGFVEIGGIALLVGSGLTAPAATAAMVLYRAYDFWIPLAVGGLCSLRLGRRSEEPAG